jgi:hypothetical protein
MYKQILSFDFGILNSMKAINNILGKLYEEANSKFSIEFLGSKGYLHFIEFKAEVGQKENNNRIDFILLSHYKNPEDIKINVFYSEKKGARLEVENLKEIEKYYYEKHIKNENN